MQRPLRVPSSPIYQIVTRSSCGCASPLYGPIATVRQLGFAGASCGSVASTNPNLPAKSDRAIVAVILDCVTEGIG